METILGWLVPFKKQLAIALVLAVTHSSVYFVAQANQRTQTAERTKSAALEGVKTHAKTEQEVVKLPDTELDSRLAKWLRD